MRARVAHDAFMTRTFCTLAPLLLAAPSAAQTPCFEVDSRSHWTNVPFTGAALGDLDGDGFDDFVLTRPPATPSLPSLAILRGSPDGFGAAIHVPGALVGAIALGDLDGDGDLDVVTTTFVASGAQLIVRKNLGGGALGPEIAYAIANSPQAVVLGDLDGDGDLDVLTQHTSNASLGRMRNLGDGTLVPEAVLVLSSIPRSVRANDIDGDGDLDVIAAIQPTGVSVVPNAGGGTFTTSIDMATPFAAAEVEVADLDGDGKRDLVTVCGPNVLWIRNLGALAFAAPQSIATPPPHPYGGSGPSFVRCADVDGDGDVDLVAEANSTRPALFQNSGGATFTTGFRLPGALPTFVTLTDSDRDGRVDLLTATYDGTIEQIALHGAPLLSETVFATGIVPAGPGAGGSAKYADFNGDGRLDLLAMGAGATHGRVMFGASGATFVAGPSIPIGVASVDAGDIDGDGDVDLAITESAPPGVRLYANDGLGAFTPGASIPLAGAPRGIAIFDADQDGDMDIAAGDSLANFVLATNNGALAFSVATTPGSGVFQVLQPVDVDGDGALDLIASNSSHIGAGFKVLRNQGGGSFSQIGLGATYFTSAPAPLLGDLDLDGDVDIVWTGQTFANDGSGIFTIAGMVNSSVGTLADTDGDGDLDFVATGFGLEVSTNDGLGTFTPAYGVPLLDTPWSVRLADLDGDGDKDWMGIRDSDSAVFVVRSCASATHAFCAGDGSATACPCANPGATGRGCASSIFAGGARLSANHYAGTSATTSGLQLAADNISGPCLFAQGTSQAGVGAGIAFGDGLLCIGGSIARLGVVIPSGGVAVLPNPTAPTPISIAGGGLVAGDVRHYQAWYRDALAFCTSAMFNLTQAVTVTFGP